MNSQRCQQVWNLYSTCEHMDHFAFLRSHADQFPTLYDGARPGALGHARVKPITLSSPLLEKIKGAGVVSGKPGSMLVAGTAGDGRTYRPKPFDLLGGADKDWCNGSAVKMLTLADGRRAVFVKDLRQS